jgi:uncharacterized protein YicC (UPF0701 family)
MDPGQIAVCIPIVALFIPISAIWTHHLRKMAEIKAQQGTTVAPDIRRELTEIKQQVAELRDTTTRFDMSFDAALTRLEQRMDSVETQAGQPRITVTQGADNTETVLVQGRRR